MLEYIDTCPICLNMQLDDYMKCKDHMVTGENFTITQCSQCGFLLTNPRPNEQHLRSYYKSDQYISHTDKSNNLINTIYKVARVYTLNKKVKLISKFVKEKSILDFGCGTGDFLLACKNKQWEIHGFEPDPDANYIAKNKTAIEIEKQLKALENLSNISIITLWHVLEHIPDLNTTIKTLSEILSKSGKIIIAVPNHECLDAKIYQEHWAAYDVPRHLYHFTQDTMPKLLSKHGLKINQILPMKLDSFYVSLLSEKYKTGASKLVKSFVNGCKSNIYANKNNNNFSSLIYIVSK